MTEPTDETSEHPGHHMLDDMPVRRLAAHAIDLYRENRDHTPEARIAAISKATESFTATLADPTSGRDALADRLLDLAMQVLCAREHVMRLPRDTPDDQDDEDVAVTDQDLEAFACFEHDMHDVLHVVMSFAQMGFAGSGHTVIGISVVEVPQPEAKPEGEG